MAMSNKAIPFVIGAIALVAVVWFGGNMSTDEEITGTVAPAERYRAEQPSADDIQLGDQQLQEVLQAMSNSAFRDALANAAFHDAMANAAFRDALNSAAFRDALGNAAFHNALNNAAFRNALDNAAFLEAMNNAAFRDALNNAAFRDALNNAAFRNALDNRLFAARWITPHSVTRCRSKPTLRH